VCRILRHGARPVCPKPCRHNRLRNPVRISPSACAFDIYPVFRGFLALPIFSEAAPFIALGCTELPDSVPFRAKQSAKRFSASALPSVPVARASSASGCPRSGSFASASPSCSHMQCVYRSMVSVFAERAKAIAEEGGLNGKPVGAYVRLVQKHRNNLRAVLQGVDCGETPPE
jgi:hypothetical protein